MAAAQDQQPVEAIAADGSDPRTMCASAFGAWTGVVILFHGIAS